MKKERPVNLDLSTIKFPAAAKASILHRISGVVMLVSLAFLIWAFAVSLSGPEGFAQIENLMTSFIAKFIGWGILTALGFHIIPLYLPSNKFGCLKKPINSTIKII